MDLDRSSMISLSHSSLFSLRVTVRTKKFGEAKPGGEGTGNWMRAFFPLGLSFSICKIRGCTRNDKWLASITQVSPSSPTTDTTNGLQHYFTWITYTALDSSAGPCRLVDLRWHTNDTYLLIWRAHPALACKF